MGEKMRVHILAKELNVTSKIVLEKCRAEGLGEVIKNHMSTLSAGLDATIREWFSDGTHANTVETAARVNLEKVRVRPKRKRKASAPAGAEEGQESAPEQVPDTAGQMVAEAPPAPVEEAPAEVAAEAPEAGVVTAEVQAPESLEAPAAEEVAEVGVKVEAEAPADAPAAEAPVEAGVVDTPAEPVVAEAPAGAETPEQAEPEKLKKTVAAAGPQHVPAPAKLKGPRVVRYETPERDVYIRRPPPRQVRPPGEGVGGGRGAPAPVEPKPGTPDAGRPGAKPGVRKPRVSPRRAAGRAADAGERLAEWRDQDLAERRQRLQTATGRRIHRRRAGQAGGAHVAPSVKTEVTLREPVYMKDFCAATGLNFVQLFQVLQREHNLVGSINMVIPNDIAVFLGMHFGIEIGIVPAMTRLDVLKEEFAQRERKHPQPRPPVVTMLGHVDHGKTSLLDAIRKTRVVSGEDGGITQHIGASYLETPLGTITFLDTPGHAAFTAMRARGAQMTDVVVLVVAADDGVMPQTTEAINHTKAAEVSVVVALTKIDLGDQNLIKTYGQLSEQGLTPSGDWGGEVDVIPTSVVSGQGIDDLLEHIVALGELLDLKADPTLPATGTVIEAETKEGVGAVVRVLVQEGTLRVGDIVVCGGAFGKVRALLNDRGVRVTEAAPAVPIEVWGLDDVPIAGDRLYCVDNPQVAKEVAAETKLERVESGRLQSQKMRSLEEMFQRRDAQEVPELNLIIKADVDGSIAALRQTLMDLPTDEVRLTIRHAAVGAVNDSDVQLAAACDGIIAAFRVDAAIGARRLAEQHGVDIRPYRVIYDVADEIKKALEGLLTPEQKIESRGKAEARNVFHISKVGMVAGCYVTEGVVNRSHLVKVIRDGVVVREGCKLASVRRFKEDAKEVRAGLECGLRLEGFDDVHVGDILETYEIIEIARTL